jgi:hypothetical protein
MLLQRIGRGLGQPGNTDADTSVPLFNASLSPGTERPWRSCDEMIVGFGTSKRARSRLT